MSQTKAQLIDNLVQPITGALGSASAPTFSFTADPNTGLYSPGADQLAISTNGSKRLHVDASGNVGIGMTPVYAFDVTAGNGNAIRFTDSVNSVQNLIGAFNSNGFIGTASNHPLYFTTNGSERMRLDTSGRLGLGTSSPSATLDVNGNTRISGGGIRALGYYSDSSSAYNVSIGTTGNVGYLQAVNVGNPSELSIDGSPIRFRTGSFTEAVRIDASGRVGIGTTSPGYKLHCVGDARFESSNVFLDDDNKALVFGTGTTAYIIGSSTNNNIRFVTNSSERGRWDSSGRFLVGTSTSTNNVRLGEKLAVVTTGGSDYGGASLTTYAGSTAALSPLLEFQRSRGTTDGSMSAVGNGDSLGQIIFRGATGSAFETAANITAEVDGAVSGAGDIPGRLTFSTTADGASSPTERARITSAGFFKATNNSGNYDSATGTFHEFVSTDSGNPGLQTRSTNGSFNGTVIRAMADRAASTAYWFTAGISGNGADTEFYIRGDGNAFADGSWSGGGADYAEYFEWSDGNPDEEDRRGISVVLDGEKIRPAQDGEEPIGVISGNPSVIGDAAATKWVGKYLRDDYGSYVLDENGERQLNPAYDPDQEYTPREQRPEWDCVGLMGKLRIRKGQPTGSRWIKMRDISDSVEEWLVR